LSTSERLAQIKLVISDIDGTIVGGEVRTPSPRTIQAVHTLRAAGLYVSLATARTWTQTWPLVQALGLQGEPMICCQGADLLIATDPPEILHQSRLPAALAIEIVGWIRGAGLRPAAVPHTHHVWEASEEMHPLIAASDPAGREVNSLIETCADGALKVMGFSDQDFDSAFLLTARAAFAGRANLGWSSSGLLEWTALDADKGQGADWLAGYLNIEPEHILALGDADNDLPLLAAVGYRVAIGSNSAALCELADECLPGVAQDGAAIILEKVLSAQR
jgi:Cof subfamily protein (haloacid dehalogenase superfamily)